jgi:hypothetical protein
VLIHLRDQLLALERIASVVRSGGVFVSAEEYDRLASLFPWSVARYRLDDEQAVVFWRPSKRAWRRMLWSAGFDRVERHGTFVLQPVKSPHVVHHAFKK